MNISKKIKAGRESKGWSQADLSQYSGVSLDSIKRYESKESNITIGNLIKIADSLEVDLNFFRNNDTQMSLSQNQFVPKSPKNLSLSRQQSVPKSKKMSSNQNITDSLVDQKAFVSDSLVARESFVSQDTDPSQQAPLAMLGKPTTIQIPVYDEVYASVGEGLLNDEHISRHIGIEKDFLRDYFGLMSFLGLSIITARGDSMSPTIPENCQLLIQRSDQFQEGQICVVRLENELYVKRLQKRPKYKLISDNKNYDDIELENEDYEIIGVVVGFFKRMI